MEGKTPAPLSLLQNAQGCARGLRAGSAQGRQHVLVRDVVPRRVAEVGLVPLDTGKRLLLLALGL
eukprot:14454618-Alexandrium_andersonii.AAC.1